MAKKKTTELNLKQEAFCKLYATEVEFFGNGVQSYIEAYDIDVTSKGKYAAAGRGANRLLKNAKILAYINDIMEETGFSNEFADKQLSFIMTQNAELGVKLGAIKEFNVLKKRITNKLEHSGSVELKAPQVN